MKNPILLGFLLIGVTALSVSEGGELNDVQIYKRCYNLMTSSPLPLDDSLLKQIKTNSKKGPDACMELLGKATQNGKRIYYDKDQELEKKIFQTFQGFHNNWFSRFNFNEGTQDFSNTNLFDANEMGYHVTWSLFQKKSKFSKVFTARNSFRSIRLGGEKNEYANDLDIGGKRHILKKDPSRKWKVGGIVEGIRNYGDKYFTNPKLVSFGHLVGLLPMRKKESVFRRLEFGKKTSHISLFDQAFPGVMGTIPYLLLNAGHINKTTDGGRVVHRRWSTAFFKDLFCREMPVLRQEDYLETINTKSKIGFRKKAQCWSCHATIDPLADIIRNVEIFNSGDVDHAHFTFKAVDNHPPLYPALKQEATEDRKFYKRKPTGKLSYRTFDGKLINQNLASPRELGRYIATLEDPYICAAKRYFLFLTGIDVLIGDFPNSLVSENEKKFIKYRNFVIKIGRQLKRHQDLKLLVRDIVSSEFFKNSDFGVNE